MPALDICVIGTGFAGLSAATCLADQGHNVILLEKNKTIGGRARKLEADGFMFDMGPSWYWMPDVFDRYFALFGKKPSDYYHLKRLDPSYTVVFDKDDHMKVPAKMSELEALFESLEKGAGKKLQAFLSQAEYKYEVGINDQRQTHPADGIPGALSWRHTRKHTGVVQPDELCRHVAGHVVPGGWYV